MGVDAEQQVRLQRVVVEGADDDVCHDDKPPAGEEAGQTIKGLKSAEGFVRRQLASRINLRNTPEITFVLDQSIEYGVNMTHLINEVTKDLDTDEPEADEDEL